MDVFVVITEASTLEQNHAEPYAVIGPFVDTADAEAFVEMLGDRAWQPTDGGYRTTTIVSAETATRPWQFRHEYGWWFDEEEMIDLDARA